MKMLSLAITLFCCGVVAAADEVSQVTSTPIVPASVAQLRSSKELSRGANRILRGPRSGEMTLLHLYDPIEVVDAVNLRTLRTIAANSHPNDVAVSSDGRYLMWTEGGGSYTLHETDGKSLQLALGANECRAAFSPDNTLMAVGQVVWFPGQEGVGESQVKLFDLSGKLVRTLEKSGAGFLTPVFSPDGKILAVGNLNHETQLFEVSTGRRLYTLNRRGTREIAFSPDGKTLGAGYVDGTLALWDVTTGQLRYSKYSGCEQVFSVDWSPKGDLVASAGTDWKSGKIALWDPKKLTKLKEVESQKIVWQVRFTSDGTGLVSSSAADNTAGSDEKIQRWAISGDGDGLEKK